VATVREQRDGRNDAIEVDHGLVRHFHAQVGSHASLGLGGDNSFTVDYMQSSVAMREPTVPWKAEPAIRLSVATSSLKPGVIRLWVDGKSPITTFRASRAMSSIYALHRPPWSNLLGGGHVFPPASPRAHRDRRRSRDRGTFGVPPCGERGRSLRRAAYEAAAPSIRRSPASIYTCA